MPHAFWENIEVFQQWYASYFNYCVLKRHFVSAGICESTGLDDSPGLGRLEHVMFGFGPGTNVGQIVKNKGYMEYFGHSCVIRISQAMTLFVTVFICHHCK